MNGNAGKAVFKGICRRPCTKPSNGSGTTPAWIREGLMHRQSRQAETRKAMETSHDIPKGCPATILPGAALPGRLPQGASSLLPMSQHIRRACFRNKKAVQEKPLMQFVQDGLMAFQG
jgi:hypothetical protein